MLTHYLELLRQFRTTIILVALAGGLLTCAASIVLLQSMPLYKTSVTINMEPSEEALRFNRSFLGVSQFNPSTIIVQTHIERLLSRRVAERALDMLQEQSAVMLGADPPDALDRLKARAVRYWAQLNYGYFEPASEREQLVNELMEATDVRAVLGSYILMLEVTYRDPAIATRIANALSRAYVEVASEDFAREAAAVDAALATLQWEKEAELNRHAERRRTLDRELGFESVEDGRAILLGKRTEARMALVAAERALVELRAALDGAGSEDARSLRADLNDAMALLERRVAALDAVEAELQTLDRTETELAEIEQRIGEAERDLAELQRQRITTELARRARLNQVSIINEAVTPAYPAFPKVLVNTAVATGLAGLLAIAVILAKDVLGDQVRTSEDLRQAVGARALPTVTRRLAAQAQRFLRTGRDPGRYLRQFAETLGRRFLTEGRRRWPDARIYVTAIGTPADVARLATVIKAAARCLGQGDDAARDLEVVVLPEMSRIPDLASYRDGALLIGIASGRSDRVEVARLGDAGSDCTAATAPFLTVLI